MLHPAFQGSRGERSVFDLRATIRGRLTPERVIRTVCENATIRSLVLGPGESAGCMRFFVQVECASAEIPDILRALDAVPGIVGVVCHTGEEAHRAREYALFDVAASGDARTRVIEVASVFRGRVVDACEGSLTLELCGIPYELDAAEELLNEFGVKRMLRTGPMSLGR